MKHDNYTLIWIAAIVQNEMEFVYLAKQV